MKTPTALILAALIICAAPCYGQQPAPSLPYTGEQLLRWNDMNVRDLFQDEEVLAASVLEIGTLNSRVIEALARSLADCTNSLSENDAIRDHCERARVYFEIIHPYPRGPIGLLDHAVVGITMLIRYSPRGAGTSDENVKRIERMVKINRAWSDAIRRRLSELDKVAH